MYQYLSEAQIRNIIGDLVLDHIQLMSTDTYNEEAIALSIKKLDPQICCAIAVQTSIVGMGNKKYGSVSNKDGLIDIKKYFDDNDIIYTAQLGTQLKPEQLTPRRLIRFFRFHIQEFITKKDIATYLWRKYCPIKNDETRILVFPGSEYMIDYTEEGKKRGIILYQTYINLDLRLGTNIVERIKRIMLARGFTDKEILEINKILF